MMRKSSILCMVSQISLATILMKAPALSQTTEQTINQSTETAGEITVTARKRSESLLDVPASISAFSGNDLAKAQIKSVVGLQNSVPNLQYSPRGDLENQISIRGVGGDPRNIGVESGVGIYVDEVFVGRTGGYNFDLGNVSQVEILRGPQGTIFGKNTTGGVINITTHRPGDKTEAEVSASYGNYNAIDLHGQLSGAITDNVYAGLSFVTSNRDGWLHNDYNNSRLDGVNRRAVRGQLRWLPVHGLEFYWTADHGVSRNDFALTQPAYPGTGPAAPYVTPDARFHVSMDQSNRSELNSTGASQIVDYSFDNGLTIASVTGFRRTNVLVYSDGDALPIDLLHSGPFTDRSRMITQELRLSSPSKARLRYTAGLYYFGQHATSFRDIYAAGSLAAGYVTDARVNTDAYAAYANVDFDILRNLTATGGLRYTSEHKTGAYDQIASAGRTYDFNDLHRTDRDLSWTASLTYHPVRDASLYVTVSKGFKSGGFNVDPITVAGVTANQIGFAPETVTNYEIGGKARLFDGMLLLSAAAFYDRFNDKQVSQFLPSASVPTVVITNAGKARIQGFELEATARPDPFWTLRGSLSHLDTKYLSFPNAATVNGVLVSYTGNRLENAPAWSAAASVERRQPISAGFLTIRGSARYTGTTFFQPDNAAVNRQGGYTLLDGRFGFENHSGNFEVALWAKNLTNKAYYTFSRVSINIHQVLFGEPRTYGIEVTKRF